MALPSSCWIRRTRQCSVTASPRAITRSSTPRPTTRSRWWNLPRPTLPSSRAATTASIASSPSRRSIRWPTCAARPWWSMRPTPRSRCCSTNALKDSGLNKGDYKVNSVGGTGQRLNAMTTDKANAAAGVLGLPFVFQAQAAGLKDMGPAARSIGAYQSDCAIVMREWAKANSDTLVRYIRAVVEGRRWLLDPANKAEAIQLLVDRLKLTPGDRGAVLRHRDRPDRRHRQGREVRHGRLQECFEAACRDRRPMGRQSAAARQIHRPVLLRQGTRH